MGVITSLRGLIMSIERIKIDIETCGAAFDESPATEIARILRELADRFEHEGGPEGFIYDLNGNQTGWVVVQKAD